MILRSIAVPIFLFLLACSGDKSTPVAPAGKGTAIAVDVLQEPTNLRIEVLTDTSVKVAWDAVEAATDYDLNYKKMEGGRWTNWPHRGAATLHSTIHPLEPDTEYRWAIRAQNRDGVSPWVLAEVFTTLVDPNVVPPEPYIQEEYNSIYYVDWDAFRRCDIYGGNHETLIPLSDSVRMKEFELDVATGKVYWINENDRQTPFMQADLDGSNRRAVLQDAIGPAIRYRELAIDHQRQVAYWINVDGNGGGLFHATLPDGRDKQEIFPLDDLSDNLSNITVDPSTGRLYWSSISVSNARGGGRIGSSSIKSMIPSEDSSYMQVVVECGGECPDGLIQPRHWGLADIHSFAIDAMAGKIYWSVSRLPYRNGNDLYWIHSIRRSDLDGGNIETLFEIENSRHRYSWPVMSAIEIDALGGFMFFTQDVAGALSVSAVGDPSRMLDLFYTSHGELPTVGSGYVQDFQLAHTSDF